MNRIAKFAAVVALPAALLLTACTGSDTKSNAKSTKSSSTMARGVDRTGKMTIGSAVRFTCPEQGKGEPDRTFYLHGSKVTPADIKFGTELVVGNASVTPNSCTWGYAYEPDGATAKALSLYPEAFVQLSESPGGQMEFSSENDSYAIERSGRNNVQLPRGTTQWMVLEAPGKGITLELGCTGYTDRFGCVTNWPQAETRLHKITQQP